MTRALGKIDPWWLRIGEHRDLRKRVLESSRLKDTIRAIEPETYRLDGEAKDSVDQDSHYHAERNHQGKDNVLLFPAAAKAMKGIDGSISCKERLGGLLKYYHREAA